jgi:deoxyribonuclease V
MKHYFDFYSYLRRLIEQVPEYQVTTPYEISRALGVPSIFRIVLRVLEREEFIDFADRVAINPDCEVFNKFRTIKPLQSLIKLQNQLSDYIMAEDRFGKAELIAGVDISYEGDEAYTACVITNRKLEIIEKRTLSLKIKFPYIPSFLAWREVPAIEAIVKTMGQFDVLMINGHGMAHPRGLGIASHIGLELGKVTIGVAKNLLCGKVQGERDGWSPIIYNERVVGGKIRNLQHAPIYVSVGDKISLESAIEMVKKTFSTERFPEPLQIAHKTAVEFRRISV